MKHLLFPLLLATTALADDVPQWRDLFNGKDLTGWVDVNTSKDTWSVKDGLLVCKGLPTGVMRSEKQYENFILHIEWKHTQAGGNSGVFVWATPASIEKLTAAGKPGLPDGIVVQDLNGDGLITVMRVKDPAGVYMIDPADPRTLKRQRLTFRIVAVPLLGLLAVPWLAPLFY